MQTMRDKWTDERLDDLNARVDRGFDQLRTEMRDLGAEMNARFEEMNARMDAMSGRMDATNARMDAMNARLDALARTMLWFAGALIVAIVASNLAS